MIVETSSAIRKQRVVAGQLMVTPTKRLVLVEDGRRETLDPGRTRLSRDHRAVRAHPEWFTPADPKDVDTARRHSALLERTGRALRRQLGRAGTSRASSSFRLPTSRPRERWRLP
jgi:hypothetical protein